MASALLEDIAHHGHAWQASEATDETARRQLIVAASALLEQLERPYEAMVRFCWGEPSRLAVLRIAHDLGLLAKLKPNEPLSSAQLAEGTAADVQLVGRIMRHLVAHSLVLEHGPDAYAATLFSLAMQERKLTAALEFCTEGVLPVFQSLPFFLAGHGYRNPVDGTNGPWQHGMHTDESFFDSLAARPVLGASFNAFMAGYAASRPRWIDVYPCAERLLNEGSAVAQDRAPAAPPLLVDVGGGVGHDLAAFRAKFPEAKGRLILQDRPEVLADARRAEPPLLADIELTPHDFFTPQPAEHRGARAYCLRQILHDWPDEQCVLILGHLRDAMKAGAPAAVDGAKGPASRLLVSDRVVHDVGAPWQQTALDWTMMALFAASERTGAQWRALMGRAGLRVSGIWSAGPEGESVIEAVLAEDE